MLTQEDLNTLSGMATSKLLAGMTLAAQETDPVNTLDDFETRVHALLADLRRTLNVDDEMWNEDFLHKNRAFHCYCDNADGNYDHSAVALEVQRGLSDLLPVFQGLDANAPNAIRAWLLAYGDQEHTVAWLAQRIADLSLAEAALAHKREHP